MLGESRFGSKFEVDEEEDEVHWVNAYKAQKSISTILTQENYEELKTILKQKYSAKILIKVMKQIKGMADGGHAGAFRCAVQGKLHNLGDKPKTTVGAPLITSVSN